MLYFRKVGKNVGDAIKNNWCHGDPFGNGAPLGNDVVIRGFLDGRRETSFITEKRNL